MRNVRVIYRLLFAACFLSPGAAHAVNWWEMPTVCAPADRSCYGNSADSAIDENEWDARANCRGKKWICENAILDGGSMAIFAKDEIANPEIIDSDFDTMVKDAANGCFGMRKTRNNGTQARVTTAGATEWRNVYCRGILDSAADAEAVETGEIMLAAADQPTCASLSDINGKIYIGSLDGSCYGKKFSDQAEKFYFECSGDDLLPKKIVVLNGANKDYIKTDSSGTLQPSAFSDEEYVAAIFDKMFENSQEQQRKAAAITQGE